MKKFIMKLNAFTRLYWLWLKNNYWIKRCDNPIKVALLALTEYMIIETFKQIGWWVPKKANIKIKA